MARLRLLLLPPFLLAAALAAACGSSGSGSPTAAGGNGSPVAGRATDSSGGVEVSLTRLLSAADLPSGSVEGIDPGTQVAFLVTMTTHSGDLTSYDMTQNAVLRAGDREYQAAGWLFTSKDAHHPRGLLWFPASPAETGPSFEVVVRNLGGVGERVLRFEQ